MNFAKFLRTPFLQNTPGTTPTASEERRFFKLAADKSVKTACVCIAFFFHCFKYYGQNIFSRITVLYLIAKVERKEKTFYLKQDYPLSEKKISKMFQVKVITKYVRKMIVPSFMFLFNLWKSIVLCVKKM